MTTPDTCTWTENDGYWETQCGDSFIFEDLSTPFQNLFAFCPYCGKDLRQQQEQQQ